MHLSVTFERTPPSSCKLISIKLYLIETLASKNILFLSNLTETLVSKCAKALLGSFDVIVVDPPYHNEAVLCAFSKTVRLLAKTAGAAIMLITGQYELIQATKKKGTHYSKGGTSV